MPTWNTSKPATANSVAADVADIEENFDYLEDLLTYFFKSWSASSAAIGKNSIYYVNPAAADQGADDNARSFKDLQDGIGTTKKAIFYWPHLAVDGNTTTFTFGTAETSESNITNIVEGGVIIAGAGTLTINGTMILLGDVTISGTVTVAAGARLISYGTLTVSGTLTISAGGKYLELGSTSVSGTLTHTGFYGPAITLNVNTTDASTSGTGETDLQSFAIPANTLRAGRVLRVSCSGVIVNATSGNNTFKFHFGADSTTVYTFAASESGTRSWIMDIRIFAINATTLDVIYNFKFAGSTAIEVSDTLTVDLTSEQTIKMAGTVSEAAKTITQNNMVVELL